MRVATLLGRAIFVIEKRWQRLAGPLPESGIGDALLRQKNLQAFLNWNSIEATRREDP